MQMMSDPSERVALVADYGLKAKASGVAVASAPASQQMRVARSDF